MNPTPNTQTPESQTPEATAPEAAEAGTTKAGTTATSAQDSPGTETAGEPAVVTDELDAEEPEVLGDDEEFTPRASSGLAAASSAIVALCLGIVALTGSWTGQIGAARETLVGQINMPQNATIAQQISEGYGDGWHVTALINGAVALVALIVAVVALLLPQKANWVRPFAVAAVVLGAIGVIVSLGMYFDLFAALPSAPATPPVAPPAG
ncbi:hypothetical protein [Streptomyces sp. NPDC088725]|uniref:hypothetical protein n=1 Tax=Streptomyces sp. NPDC088725 TaxID=3365873 RepID=UPI003807CE7E